MLQFKVKISKPIKNIEPQIIDSRQTKNDSNAGKEKSGKASLVEAQKIKILKDRIKILELELQRAREESFKAGYEEGKQNTLRAANERIAEARQQIERIQKDYRESVERIEKPLLELAKKMAQKVLEIELSLTDEHHQILMNQLRRMIQEVQNEKHVTVQVNPLHLPDLNSADIKEAFHLPKEMELTVLQGKQLKKGEAFVSSDHFYIDGRFESQIEELGNQLIHGEEE
ncbi:FliH/SctL family protein [Caldithrix abyssi]